MGIAMFVCIFFNDTFMIILKKIKVMREEQDIEVDEQLGTYYQCLGERNRKYWVVEESYMRRELGIQTLSNEALSQMKVNKPHNKVIKTCYNYSIVTNPKYY